MKLFFQIILFLALSITTYSQSIVQIIERNTSNSLLFEKESPTSFFNILNFNPIAIHPMDSVSEDILRPYLDLEKDLYYLGKGSFSPLKGSNGFDSIAFDLVTRASTPIYPNRDTLFSSFESISHLLIQFDTTVKSKKEISIFKIDRIYFVRKIPENKQLIISGWISFKEILLLDKINYISLQENSKEIYSQCFELKKIIRDTLVNWDKSNKSLYIEKDSISSFFLNTINPNCYIQDWLPYKGIAYQENRHQLPFENKSCKELMKSNYGSNHIYRLRSYDRPLVNIDGNDSLIWMDGGQIVVVYPTPDTVVIWADYPVNRIHLRFSSKLEIVNNLPRFTYSIDEIYFVQKFEGNYKCFYNLDYKFLSNHYLFKNIPLPVYSNEIYTSRNETKNKPDWFYDLENGMKSSKNKQTISKRKNNKKFNSLVFNFPYNSFFS